MKRIAIKTMRCFFKLILLAGWVMAFTLSCSRQQEPPSSGELSGETGPEKTAAVSGQMAEVDIESVTGEACGQLVVAEVNGAPIYLEEVLAFTRPKEINLVLVRKRTTRWESIREIRRNELDKRIKGRLYRLEAASDPSVQPLNEEIEEAFQEGVNKFGSEEAFRRFKGVSDNDDLKADLALNISVMKMINKHVIDKIVITPEEKEEYYLLHQKDKFTIPAQAAVRVLFRFYENEEERQAQLETLKKVRAEIEEALSGVEEKNKRLQIFSGFVRSYSEHKETRFNGGYWHIYGGHFIQEQFWPLEDASFEAEENVLSPIHEIGDGYCLFIVDYKIPAKQKTYAESEKEIDNIMRKDRYQALSKQWMQSLEEKFNVKIFDPVLMCGVEKDKVNLSSGEDHSEVEDFPAAGQSPR